MFVNVKSRDFHQKKCEVSRRNGAEIEVSNTFMYNA